MNRKKLMMAKWILEEEEYIDDFQHHKCSSCGALSLFSYTYNEDYDEGIDGEWVSLGYIASGINENITLYCPNCGSKMDCTEALHRIYGCKKCKWFDESSCNYGYTEVCLNCGDYPWANDEIGSKWELNVSEVVDNEQQSNKSSERNTSNRSRFTI